MTQFVLIEPKTKRAWEASYPDLSTALPAVGLRVGAVDHGTVWRHRNGRGIAVCVYEFGMFDPPDAHAYFSMATRLYAGNVVLYGFNAKGATVDLEFYQVPPIKWYANARAAETAMARGKLDPVRVGVAGEELWRWPQPGGKEAAEEAARRMAADPRDVTVDGDTHIIKRPAQ